MPIDDPIQGCATKKPEPPIEPKKEPETHFIEFNVVDEKGTPLNDVKINIVSINGKPYSGISKGKGIVRIEGIEPGDYKIVSNWKVLKVDNIVLIQ